MPRMVLKVSMTTASANPEEMLSTVVASCNCSVIAEDTGPLFVRGYFDKVMESIVVVYTDLSCRQVGVNRVFTSGYLGGVMVSLIWV